MLQNIDFSDLMLFNKLNIPPYNPLFANTEILWFNALDVSKNKYIMSQRSHHHSFFEVHFSLRGEIFFKLNSKTLSVPAENYIITAPRQKHKVSGHSNDFFRLSLGFSIPESNPLYNHLFENSQKAVKTPPEILENIIFILNQLKNEDIPFTFAIQNRILEIILSLSRERFINLNVNDENITDDARVYKAKQFIKDNISSHITCTDIATNCYLSSKQLNRIFRKFEHKSVLQYLHEQKVKHIQKLLTDTEKSLKQISIESGFINEYYFNTFFKKYSGQTPGDYRRSSPNKST